MNLRFVEAFTGPLRSSITRAAEKLHITQSAMSSRIAALEEELGVQLLDRREKQFRLTVAGQRFQQQAVRLLELQRQIKQELGTRRSGAMALRIGAIESVVHSWLPGWLQQLRSRHPTSSWS
jgi:DNA-binding transcriptional LysR family regulator